MTTENEAAKITHILLRPPPGTRFSIWGSDVRLDFQKGREREIIIWLRDWITRYIEPRALMNEALTSAERKVQAVSEILSPLPDVIKMPEVPTVKVELETLSIDEINEATANEFNGSGDSDHGKR